jgi:hypothetical protein
MLAARSKQPFPTEDSIGILKTGDELVAVVTVLVQGNLARQRSQSADEAVAAKEITSGKWC